MQIEQLQSSFDLVRLLEGIAANLASVRDEETLALAMDKTIEQLAPVEYSGLLFYDEAEGRLKMFCARGFTEEERREAERTAMDRHPGWVFRNRQMLHVPDVERDAQGTQTGKRAHIVRSRLFFPVLHRDECVGVFGIASSKPHYFDDRHVAILSFVTNLAAVVYGNLRHLRALESQLDLIQAQQVELLELSAPILEIGRGVLLLPVVGKTGIERARRIQSILLDTVGKRGVKTVIIDLTGMKADSASIAALGEIGRAVQLMGARYVISGISPRTAKALLDVDVSLGEVDFFRTAAQALRNVQF